MLNTLNNPLPVPPQTDRNYASQQRKEQDPFQISDGASIVPGSEKGSGVNLLSSQMGSSYHASQNLQGLLWQLPYAERKSILQ